MNSQESICPTCGKSKVANAPEGSCQGHLGDLKAQLDAIPTPGKGRQPDRPEFSGVQPPSKPVQSPPESASPSVPDVSSAKQRQLELRAQLNKNPAPQASDSQSASPPRAQGSADLQAQLNSIPTPQASSPQPSSPQPGSSPAEQEPVDLRSQLNAIPTPQVSATQPVSQQDDIPEWQKRYANLNQPSSAVTNSESERKYSSSAGAGYSLIIGTVIIICVAALGFAMMNKTPPALPGKTAPAQTVEPAQQTQSTQPIQPAQSAQPVQPAQPAQPVQPVQPGGAMPADQAMPTGQAIQPAQPLQPVATPQAEQLAPVGQPMQSELQLQQMQPQQSPPPVGQ